jgi:hypothetical protein
MKLSNKEYCDMFVEYVMDLYNKERGRDDVKKNNLGDIKSTAIETSVIIQEPFVKYEELPKINK